MMSFRIATTSHPGSSECNRQLPSPGANLRVSLAEYHLSFSGLVSSRLLKNRGGGWFDSSCVHENPLYSLCSMDGG